MRFRQFSEGPLDDFEGWKAEIAARGPVVKTELKSERGFLKLYHGFQTDPQFFNYTFDPAKSEQGLLWFTHAYIRGYNPVDYARDRGSYVLTYDLPIMKYSEVVTYQNGTKDVRPAQEVSQRAEPTENSRYMIAFDHVIELPEGWFFTYKTEKFVGTNRVLHAKPNQITKSE